MTYKVRKAVQADAKELARLRWEFRVEEQPHQEFGEFMDLCQVWLGEALTSGQWIVATAESATGSLFGCMYLQCVEKVPVPGGINRFWGYVTNCYVEPEHRRKGMGQQLLNLLIDAARERELEFLIVWPSEESVRFYQRAGFRPASEVHSGPDDEPPFELIL